MPIDKADQDQQSTSHSSVPPALPLVGQMQERQASLTSRGVKPHAGGRGLGQLEGRESSFREKKRIGGWVEAADGRLRAAC